MADKYDKEKSGIGGDALKEDVPKIMGRKGDGILTAAVPGLDGIDNNASIVLGRDRTGAIGGGFGKYKRAGSIDMVVGRGAPKCPPILNNQPLYMDPLFTSIIDPKIQDYKVEEARLKQDVESVAMDAARIYMSQKCRVDAAFNLVPTDNGPIMSRNNPRSAIAMKADHVRVVAREGIKIVTMGAGAKFPENVSSQGHKIIKTYGIDLIAGNGKDARGKDLTQEPLVKGHAMMKMINEMIELVDNLTGIVATFLAQQNVINVAFGAEFGASPAGIVYMDPVSRTTATLVGFDQLAKTGFSLAHMKYKFAKFKFEHGIAAPGGEGALPLPFGLGDQGDFKSVVANKSPLSRYNTTN